MLDHGKQLSEALIDKEYLDEDDDTDTDTDSEDDLPSVF